MAELRSCVSLFTGAGGLDLGLEMAGFHTVAAVESDADCVETLRANQAAGIPVPGFPDRRFLDGTKILGARVEHVRAADLRPQRARKWRPDLLVGGPPCQPFSPSGKQASLRDPRGVLFREFVRLAEELRPRLILFENVRGLVTARGPDGEPGGALRLVGESFERIGYGVHVAVLNAADFGVPQRRVRLFIMASRHAPLPVFPEPTHALEPASLFERRERWVTLGEFLAAQPDPHPEEIVGPTAQLARRLRNVPEGSGLKSAGVAEPTRPGGHWGYRQGTFVADTRKPARTVTASATQDWLRLPDGSLRRLTFRECAALQCFPRKWTFYGGKASRFRQVGNAVPGVFGYVLGRALLEALASVNPRARARSAPLPGHVTAAIDYTIRDDSRNGSTRVRSTFYRGRRS